MKKHCKIKENKLKLTTLGFTLIELLAVIIILGVLAALITPKVVSMLDKSEKNTNMSSAEALIKAATYKYSNNEITGKPNQDVIIDYTNQNNINYLDYTGTNPEAGKISIIEDGRIAMAVKFNDYCYIKNYDSQDITTIAYNEETCVYRKLFGGKVVTGEDLTALDGGYTGVKAIVYLDPTNLATVCNEEEAAKNVKANGSPTGINTGCMKWYAIETLSNNDAYTMILDHNTSDPVAWISKADYEQTSDKKATPSEVGISYDTENGTLPAGTYSRYGTNNRGPITVLKQLQEDTKDWVVAKTLTSSDTYTAEWEACSSCGSYYTGPQKYTINYNGYKARLISGEEINKIIGKEANTESAIQVQGGYLDSNCASGCSKGNNKYGWLFDHTGSSSANCESYGCNSGFNSDPEYWTSSPSNGFYGDAWAVYYYGLLTTSDVNNTSSYGARPVITVSKSILQ